jgi:flavin reductase (DIM6/NTAB) family NADH-FMN oxidoreductase RutF
MERTNIQIENLNTNIFEIFNKGWMLLTAGDFDTGFNTMTVSWGFMGTFWFKPVAIAGVRPQRHTFDFIDQGDSFTLCAFPEEMRETLGYCGSHSGSEYDKIAECGLEPVRSQKVSAPGFDQAELIIECHKIYSDELKGKNIIDKSILSKCYPERDFHKLFFGEVVSVSAADCYIK